MLGKITVQVILEKSVSQENVYFDVLQQNLIWRLKLIETVFEDLVHTALKTQCTFIRKTNWLMLYSESFTVHWMYHMKYVHCMGNMQGFVFHLSPAYIW